MHYLKCNNCGHLNEVKTQFLIFCSSCNKKLENNYSAWIVRNPDKNLDDFMKLMCVSEDEIQETIVKPKKSKSIKGLKYWVSFAVLFAIFYAIGQFGGESIVRFFKSQKTSKEVLTQKWIKETYGDFGLTVETPVKLTKSDLPIPPDLRQLIDKMDTYSCMTTKGFKIMINSVKYNPAVGSTNLQGAANGYMNEVKMQKGVTDFNYTEEYITKGDIPGFLQKGTFKKDGMSLEFINAGFASGLILWQVFVGFQTDDEVGRIASKKVIESIEINRKTDEI
jgi:hypothetical protein